MTFAARVAQDPTLYGNVGRSIFDSYRSHEDTLSFYDKKAFPEDSSYQHIGNFCHDEEKPRKDADVFRIVSFNVHDFHSACPVAQGKRRKSPHFARDVIKDFDPDMVLLQEMVPYVESNDAARAHRQQRKIYVDFSLFDSAMRDLGFVDTIKVNDHEFIQRMETFVGKGIYAKAGIIQNVAAGSLVRSRGYLSAFIAYPLSEEKLLVYNVHLTPNDSRRTTEEIDVLVEKIKRDKSDYGTENVIIMGDFNNEPCLDPLIFKSLDRENFMLVNDREKTGFNQGKTIDLIYVSSELLEKFDIKNSYDPMRGYKVAVGSTASDHYPVYLDFKLRYMPEKNGKNNAKNLLELNNNLTALSLALN
jgi:Metal-dependent hydrolase